MNLKNYPFVYVAVILGLTFSTAYLDSMPPPGFYDSYRAQKATEVAQTATLAGLFGAGVAYLAICELYYSDLKSALARLSQAVIAPLSGIAGGIFLAGEMSGYGVRLTLFLAFTLGFLLSAPIAGFTFYTAARLVGKLAKWIKTDAAS